MAFPLNNWPGYGFCLAVAILSNIACAEKIDPRSATASSDGKTAWYDCKQIGVEGKGWTDTSAFYDRLPSRAQGKVPADVWEMSRHSAGLCVRFATDAPTIAVRWGVQDGANLALPHMPATGVSGVDLYAKDKAGRWRFATNGRPGGATSTMWVSGMDAEQYLLYLPLYNGTSSIEIGIAKDRSLSKPDEPRTNRHKPIVFYGTSITQGACASRPGMAATAIVGRKLDSEIVNLGFSGCGRMEPAMAELLAELDPAVYVLDCLWNMTPELVPQRIEPFVARLRAAHPKTPILLVEDSSFRNAWPTEKGRILQDIVAKMRAGGVKDLHFLSSQGMLGDDGEGTVDGCHPNDLGMLRQANAFIGSLRLILKP